MSAITAKASRKMKKYAVLTREPRCFLGSLAFSWEQRKLSEMCGTFEYGLNAAAKEFDGKNKYIRITDIDDASREFLLSDLSSPDICLDGMSKYLLSSGDIVFARTTALCTLQVSLFGQKSIRTMMQNLFFKAPFRQAMRSIFVLPRSDLDSRV